MVKCNCWEIEIWSVPVFMIMPKIPVFISVQIISDLVTVQVSNIVVAFRAFLFIDHQHKHSLSGQYYYLFLVNPMQKSEQHS